MISRYNRNGLHALAAVNMAFHRQSMRTRAVSPSQSDTVLFNAFIPDENELANLMQLLTVLQRMPDV